MCGIYGILRTRDRHIAEEDIQMCGTASSLIMKRGPDDEGFWHNDHVAFSFRRLAIIDLSPLGHQPMLSDDGKYAIIFNGELYNFRELRLELEARGRVFKSRSDTEVVLYSLIEWGSDALKRFNGMFALGFWNEHNRSVLIARDHVGMKPLYYATTPDFFAFGSQLNQVMLPFAKGGLTINKLGLGLFLSTGHYPSPNTVYNEIRQLEPGQWLQVDLDGNQKSGEHFNLFSFYQENKNRIISEHDLKDQLSLAVQRHLLSDVPVATFLSGGLDSGIITGLTKDLVGNSLTAFTLSNPGTVLDEAERAKHVAEYLGINQVIVCPENVLDAINRFQDAYQEPFGDYSAIPAMLVTGEARKNFKVMLSGDGSDEFFFGYNRMVSMLQSAPYYQYPVIARRLYKYLRPQTPAITFSSFETMLLKRQSFMDETLLTELEINEEELVNEFVKPFGNRSIQKDMVIKLNTIHRYFQQQLLKLDRASMYNSVEARVPFADKDLMKYTIAYTSQDSTTDSYRIRKVPLQRIYYSMFPSMPKPDGRKMGFTIDMESYLSGPLKEVFMDSLNTPSVFDQFIDLKGFREKVSTGRKYNTFTKWFIFSLQSWANRYQA